MPHRKKHFWETQDYFLTEGKTFFLDAFTIVIFPFKTIDIHPEHLDRKLTPEFPTTAPIIENVWGIN